MLKDYTYITFFFIILSACMILFVAKASAQETTVGLHFSCLEGTYCKDNATCSKKSVHRALLTPRDTAKALPNDVNTYLTECLDIDSDNNGIPETICTTGDSGLDKELFCNDASNTDPQCDHYQMLKDKVGYSIDRNNEYGVYFFVNNHFAKQPKPSKIASDGLGNIIPPKIEWQSYTDRANLRRWMVWNKVSVESNDPVGIGGQQQSDLEFPSSTSPCSGISWDPYGRLFDAKSLEPIPDGQVILKQMDPATNTFDEGYSNRQNPNIINPFITGKNGVFSFIVIDGQYSLTPSHANYTHSSTTAVDLDKVSQNISRIYSDYYTTTSPPIDQKGKIQHRDIPMEPNNPAGYKYPLVILDHFEELTNFGNIRYSGAVSHPFAELRVEICSFTAAGETCESPTIYNRTNGGPDKDGKFSIELDQKKLKLGQYYRKIFTPVDLTVSPISSKQNSFSYFLTLLTSLLSFDVEAQESERSLSTVTQPIPSSLEGFAYDGQGNLLINAEVGVYVAFSDSPIFKTRTDATGYFKITSEFLPKTTYTIRYTSPNPPHVQTLLTTSQFLTQNKEFIEAEKVNIFLVTTKKSDPRRNVTPKFVPNQKTTPLPNVTQIRLQPTTRPNTNTAISTTSTPSNTNNLSLIIGIVLLILSLGGAIVLYFVMKKQR